MPKLAKSLLAVLLSPFCWGATLALMRVIRGCGDADRFWAAALAGAACWITCWLLLPKPMRLYVIGHELTHALWTWLCGGEVKRFKASARGGHVVSNRANFLVVLAPYFFPVYAVALGAVYGAGHLLLGWTRFPPWLHLLLGAAYAFHVTFTLSVLQTRQSDIVSQGYLFSAVVIWLGNMLVPLLAVPLLTDQVRLLTALRWWMDATGEPFRAALRLLAS